MKYECYRQRRAELVARCGYPVILFAGLEDGRHRFVQDSSFFYYTGTTEPGMAILLLPGGPSILFLPLFTQSRAQWMGTDLRPTPAVAAEYGFDECVALGEPCKGYQIDGFGPFSQWQEVGQRLLVLAEAGNKLGTVRANLASYRVFAGLSALSEAAVDCSVEIAAMRRTKDKDEIAALFKAGDITVTAHEAAVMALKPGETEARIRASIDYIFAQEGAEPAFPSIVAAGKNATILHYDQLGLNAPLNKGELVIVDIGARFDQYCADVTRTYPVGGKFSKRQKEVYEAVLKAQEAAISLARPGAFLKNDQEPSKSLYHCVCDVLKTHGLADYFIHGAGHFLGLDVHDVGEVSEPLRLGDVITIEPGVYLPDERMGIRIEDDFWIVEDGSVCLTDQLPKTAGDVEQFIADARR